MECGETAHRKAHDVSAIDAEAIDHHSDVLGRALLRIGGKGFRNVRGRITAGIKRNAAIAPAKVAQLHFPAAEVAGELVQEDYRPARSYLFIEKRDPILCGRVSHAVTSMCRSQIYGNVEVRAITSMKESSHFFGAVGFDTCAFVLWTDRKTIFLSRISWHGPLSVDRGGKSLTSSHTSAINRRRSLANSSSESVGSAR